MAVVVARRNAKKGKGDSQGQPDQGQFSEVIKASFPRDKKSFKLTSEKVDGGATKAYVKSMVQHALMHYENFVKSSQSSPTQFDLDILDIIHYHVMGDYRAAIKRNCSLCDFTTYSPAAMEAHLESHEPEVAREVNQRLEFAYSAKNTFGGNGNYESENAHLGTILRQSVTDGNLYAVYQPNGLYRPADVPWMSKELNVGSSGQRLMLPSIGTQVISIFGYDADPVDLQKSLINLAGHLDQEMVDRNVMTSTPVEQHEEEQDGQTVIVNHEDAILTALVHALENDPDLSDETKRLVRTTEAEAADYASNGSDYRQRFFENIVTSTTSRFIEQNEVYLTNLSRAKNSELEVMEEFVGENVDKEEIPLTVTLVKTTRDERNNIRYSYDLQGTYEPFTLTDVPQDALKPRSESDRGLKKKDKRFVAPPSPERALLYRCIVDHLAAMQAYLYLVKAGKSNPPPVLYLSEALTPNKQARYIASTQYPNLRPPSHGREFDSTPVNYFGTQRKGKISLKGKDALLYKLIAMRQVYTQASLQAQRSSKAVFDKKVFDDFYKDDLRLKEITWLAYALSEEGKVLVEKPRQEDPMAVLMYRRPGADAGVTATAPADLRTAFYRIDAPMIKEVYTVYVSRFNELTLLVAYQVESASAEPKAGKIAQAVWAQIRRKTADIFNEGVIPYDFFRSLFSAVNASLAQRVGAREAYPPSWSGTNKMAQLTQNPLDLGITVTPTMYQEALVEYIEFLRGTQASSPTVASAVLSSIETYTIDNAQDYQVLRDQFLERLKDNEKNSKMKLINYHFQAYAEVLAIMRAELAIPLELREGAIAAGLERDALRAQLRDAPAGDVSIKAYPTGHPRAPQTRNQAQNINVNLNLGEGLADLVAQIRGMEVRPVEAEPVEAEPVEAEPVEAEPAEAEPVEAEPVEAEPVEEEPVPEELLDELQHGDAPPEEAPEAPEEPGVPQAFLDAAPIIADPNNIQAIEERGYDG